MRIWEEVQKDWKVKQTRLKISRVSYGKLNMVLMMMMTMI